MLTKDLLLYRVRQKLVRPSFVDASAPALVSLASDLAAIATSCVGEPLGDAEERLAERAGAFDDPKIAQGLAKLLVDRLEVEEASPEAAPRRRAAFDASSRVLRALPEDASPADFEAALRASLDRPLEAVRAELFSDLPDARAVLSFDPIEPRALLDRYNLALVQGLLLRARRLKIRTVDPDVVRVRRVLRWLRFCRLVADVREEDGAVSIEVEGPGEVLSMSRKYGLQLAIFAEVVPLLARWELEAGIELSRDRVVPLVLDERAPLVAPPRPLGHVPEEIAVIAKKLADETWEIDTTPPPRHVGAGSLCMPDLVATHRPSGIGLAVEFFHRWHRHAFTRRLADLALRPDPTLLLAVDEAVLDDALEATVDALPRAMTFRGFPSERKLRALLESSLAGRAT